MAKKRSVVYQYFTEGVQVQDQEGKTLWQWQCKDCSQKVGANIKEGTSNLWKHLKKKKCNGWDRRSSSRRQLQQPSGPGESSVREPAAAGPEEDEAMPLLQPSGPGEPSDREPAGQEEDEATRDLARMIAFHGYDPSVVEDDYFRSFVRRLNPGFELPSREAIEKICSDIFQDFRTDMYGSDEDDPEKVSAAVGQSKTIEAGQVVYATSHFIDHNWNLHREVDNVRMALPVGDHYHVPLRQVPVVYLDDMVDDIVDSIEGDWWFGQKELFMIAGETTGHINHLKLKDRIQEEGLVENSIYSATYMDHVLHSIARCLLPDPEFAKKTFDTIRLLLKPELNKDKQDIYTKLGLLDDPWEYDEHWYSCCCSLEILDQTLPVRSDVFPTFLERFYKMLPCSYESCSILLRTLLGAIYGAIRRVSDSSRPTSNLCLQELFNVRGVLKSQLLKASAAAHAGNYTGFGNKNAADVLSEALETVDKAIQDSYLVWSIPLVLDPRHKLRSIKKYFKNAFGLSEAEKYVSEVRRTIKELYTSYDEDGDDIEDGDEDSDGSTEEMSVDSSTHLVQALDEQCSSQDDDSHAEDETQLDRYLQDSLVRRTEGFDILNWWKDHGSVQYPTVARMAKDALAMPTCSKLTSNQIGQVKSMLRGYHRFRKWQNRQNLWEDLYHTWSSSCIEKVS